MQRSAQVPFLNTIIILQYSAEVLYMYFPFHHTEYEKAVYSSQFLIKFVILAASSRTFLIKTGFSFS